MNDIKYCLKEYGFELVVYLDKIEICENDEKRVIAIEKIERVILTDERRFRGYIEFVEKGRSNSINFYQAINSGKAVPIVSREQKATAKEIKAFIEEKISQNK